MGIVGMDIIIIILSDELFRLVAKGGFVRWRNVYPGAVRLDPANHIQRVLRQQSELPLTLRYFLLGFLSLGNILKNDGNSLSPIIKNGRCNSAKQGNILRPE